MTLIQQKRREEIEAHKKAEELQKVEDADRKKKQERVSVHKITVLFSWRARFKECSAPG